MPAISKYGATGDPYLDGLLSGKKWAVSTLSFSFPTKGSFYGTGYGSGENTKGFEAFTKVQANAVRDILKMYASVTNLSFSEKTESSTVHADLRFAETDAASTAWGYYPSTSAAGGDVWLNNSKNYYETPVRGNYAWLTMMHEVGHSLGLKHAHEASGVFNALPADRDSLEYSIMSYRSYVGGPTGSYTVGSTSYPQTLMMLDIAAIQKLYGADYTTNAGDTLYSWNPLNGQMSLNGQLQAAPAGNKIFMTIWDGSGNDTYSFADYATGVTVDLAPGAWTTTSAAQLASLGPGKAAVGNIANALLFKGNSASLIENAVGGSGADKISGNAAANKLTGGGGDDVLDGRAGVDTAVYSGARADYVWARNADLSWSISDLRGASPDGTDILWNIERLQFADGIVTLGTTSDLAGGNMMAPQITAKADSYSAKMNSKLVVKMSKGVLRNDDGDDLSAQLISGPSKGKLKLKDDGSFTFTPQKNFTGTVKFKYVATDGEDQSSVVKASIKVSKTIKSSGSSKGNEAEEHGAGDGHHQSPVPSLGTDSFQFRGLPTLSVPDFSFQSTVIDSVNAVLSSLGSYSSWATSYGHHDFTTPDLPKVLNGDHWWL